MTEAEAAAAAGSALGEELPEMKFIAFLVNEDTTCPNCHRPFLPWDDRPKDKGGDGPLVFDKEQGKWLVEETKEPAIKEGEGYVIPLLLKCNHAVCQECAPFLKEEKVAFIGSGVRCPYEKRDQYANTRACCRFVTPCKEVFDLPVSSENMLLTKIMHDVTGIMLGDRFNPDFEGSDEFFFYFKYCYHCQRESSMICDKCHIAACPDCWKEHHASQGHTGMTVQDYETKVVKGHKCEKCGEPACKYCGICRKFLCRNREKCFDPCMDPDHLLVEFDPNLVEIRKLESTAVDNSRKMFIYDVHDYLETDPFVWEGVNMECLKRTMWYQEYKRCHGNDGKGGTDADDVDGDDENPSEDDDDIPQKKPEEKSKAKDEDSDSGNESGDDADDD